MGLFRKSPPPRPALQHRVPCPWDPPETEFPAIVPISTLQFGRSEQTVKETMGLDRIPACQGKAVRPSRIERDACKPLVERIHKGARCLRLRSEPQVRETLLPALPDTNREEELAPHLAENRLVEIRA